ncbi:MAG: hypothetical protein A2X86_12250 [Bdellovibrionales bacterium GWA2_49_15]|nr:MAG: hypothetical protein A2X86_12250 [Bdellovibrionales bacterium GWA2_49_15]
MISIIIPTRDLKRKKNAARFFRPLTSLPDLIASIKTHVTIEHEIIVVCNDSAKSDLVDFIKQQDIKKYCFNNVNVGVSRAWNMGRQMAEGDALMFINDDVTIGAGAVETMYRALVAEEKLGIVGPKGEYWKGSAKVNETYENAEVDVISGYCFLVKTSVYDQVGGFDTAYTPAGFEEIDFNFSVSKAGFRRKVIGGLAIVTNPCHGISSLKTEIKYLYSSIHTEDLHLRNKSYFEKKWGISIPPC